ncbi:MAG: hypothetical protein CVU61_02550 [Deltaproteobacteria bacterium HGW-Deltaproteobacteria-19]|jgi:hypothetical protein|nr:MAG: hypothetical protein CVU61_02550 [Deltaproteobacteria bacterium HGW-Deltaproteobacteria-19]
MIAGRHENGTRPAARALKILAVVVLVAAAFLAMSLTAGAAEGRYQVVAGTDEKAYLVDTVTGAVWILTHRALATGREPIAIPYKFIKVSPRSSNPFLDVEVVRDVSMPPGGGKDRETR